MEMDKPKLSGKIIDPQVILHNQQLIEWKQQFNDHRATVLFAVALLPDGEATCIHVTGLPKDKIVMILRQLANAIDVNGQKHGIVL